MLTRTSRYSRFLIIQLYILCFSCYCLPCFAQQNHEKQDFANDSLLKEYSRKTDEMQKQRIADSAEKQRLEKQISILAAGDSFRIKFLQARLDSVKNNESGSFLQNNTQLTALRQNANGQPVIPFFKDTLFIVYSGSGSFSAKERAEAITRRILNLTSDHGFSPDSLLTIHTETSTDIAYKDRVIMSISDNDALWQNTSKDSLATKYLSVIKVAVSDYRSRTSFKEIIIQVGLALLCIVVIGLIIFFIARLFKWTATRISTQEGKSFKGFKIRDYVLLDSQKQLSVLLFVNTCIKWIVILIAIYIALPILFHIFPSTEELADTLFGYILTPVKSIAGKIWDYLPNLFTIIVVYALIHYVIKLIHFLKQEIENGKLKIPGFYPDWANSTFQILRVLVYAFMLIVIFPYLPGSDSPIFKGVSVFLGLLFTFGSAGSLSNIASGLILTYMRLFKIGDRVRIGDVTGDVIEKSMLVTRVKTIKNEIISIPNSAVMSSHTINYSSEAPDNGLIIYSTVTIGYDVPWKDMHQALIDAALRTSDLLKDPAPFVLQTSLDDFYVSYQINAYTRMPNKQAAIYSALHQNIQDVCNERGIEIMSPHYRAGRDGNQTTIPSQYHNVPGTTSH